MARQKKSEPKKPEPKKIEPLTEEELVQSVKELESLSKEEKAKKCGYYIVTKNGAERVNMIQFLNALIEAEGIELDGKASANGHGGRSANYRISVQTNGNLLIGKAYTKQLELKPGDEFEVTLGRKHVYLKRTEQELGTDIDVVDDR